MTEQHVISRNGARIHSWLSGPHDGPLIVLSHGATMDHRMFAPQVGPLTKAGYRVLTWDLRGHGWSQPLGRTPIDVHDMTDDLVALLDELGHDTPLCIGGQSLGGYVAQDFVHRFPGRVPAVVIIGSTSTTMPISRWEDWGLRSSPLWFRLWPWRHLQQMLAKATAVRPEVRDYALAAVGGMTKRDFVEVWRGVTRALDPDPTYRIDAPLLLTHGERDRTGNIARTAPKWAAREPQCRYEVIPDAAHNANQDNPAFFNRVLLEFLTEHYPIQLR